MGFIGRIGFFFYDIAWSIALTAIRSGLLGPKKKEWLSNRKKAQHKEGKTYRGGTRALFFCASLGEYERIKPFLTSPLIGDYEVVEVCFFSPSGYDKIQYSLPAEVVFSYAPIDQKKEVAYFFATRNVVAVFISSNEIWPSLLSFLGASKVPYFYLGSSFYGQTWLKRLAHKCLSGFLKKAECIYVIDLQTRKYLNNIDVYNTKVTGDPRVSSILGHVKPEKLLQLEEWTSGRKLLICGSSHPDDEALIIPLVEALIDADWNILIAPHDNSDERIADLRAQLPLGILFSQLKECTHSHLCILDTWGVLKHCYAYAEMCYVGGGFESSGIHNIIEPAAAGCDINIGPNYQKFPEARALVTANAIKVVSNSSELMEAITSPAEGQSHRQKLKADYLLSQQNAFEKIREDLTSRLASL